MVCLLHLLIAVTLEASNRSMKPTQHFVIRLPLNAHADVQSAGWLISFSLGQSK